MAKEPGRSIGIELSTHQSPIQGLIDTPVLSLENAIKRAQEGDEELREANISEPVTEALAFAKEKKEEGSFIELTIQKIAAVHVYTKNSPLYAILNARLRAEDRERLKPFLFYIKLLLSALYKLPMVSAVVYRGVKKDLTAEVKKDEVLIWWSFTSTSFSIQTLQDERFLGKEGKRSLFTLHVTSGVDIMKLSAFKEKEKEILLLPGTCFVVEGILDQGESRIYQLREKHFPGLLDFSRPARGSFPSRNPNFIGREEQLNEMKEKLKGNPKERLSQLVLVGGGGMGKSSLALEYLHRHHPNHTFTRWIPSEKNVAGELKELAIFFEVVEKNTSPEEAAERMLEKLKNQLFGWLLIFDNVESTEQIKKYLPHPTESKGHVIITTRDQKVLKDPFFDPSLSSSSSSSSSVIQLSPLASLEGVDVLLQYSDANDPSKGVILGESEMAAAKAISEELGELPLALTQAGSFMKQEHFTPSEYLELLRKERKDLMETQELPVDYPFSVVTTWKISVEKIRESSPESLSILLRSLFVDAESIPQGVLSWEGEESMGRLQWIKRISPLLRYSLLTEAKPGYFFIHRLTQSTLRDELSEEERKAAMDQVGLALEKEWKYDHNLPSTWPSSKELVPHVEGYISHGRKDERVARLLYGLGYLHTYLEVNLSKAETFMMQSLELNRELHGESDHPDTAMSLFGLGRVFERKGNLPGALDYHSQSLEMRRNIYGEVHSDVALSLNDLGKVYYMQRNLSKAIEYHTQSLEMRRKIHGEEHPDVASSLNNLAITYKNQGNLPKAIEYYTQSLEMRRKIYRDEHPQVANTLNNLGTAFIDQGNLPKAIEYFSQSLEMYRKIFGEEHPDVATSLTNLANAHKDQGNLPKALDYYNQSLEMRRKLFGENHPQVAMSLRNMAIFYENQSNLPKAVSHYTESHKIYLKIYGNEHPYTKQVHDNLLAAKEKEEEQKRTAKGREEEAQDKGKGDGKPKAENTQERRKEEIREKKEEQEDKEKGQAEPEPKGKKKGKSRKNCLLS